MTVLHPLPVQSTQFTWMAKYSMFVTEASSLPNRGAFERVYDDACDVGLTLVSRYPGRKDVVFVVEHEERRDGDVLYWDLMPAELSQRKLVPFTVRVYND